MNFVSLYSINLDPGQSLTPLDAIVRREEDSAASAERSRAREAILMLSTRMRDALLARFSCHPQNMTVASLAKRWHVSETWVYQLAKTGLMQVQHRLEDQRELEKEYVR